MTIRLSFDLATVARLADHAAAYHADPAGAALLLSSGVNGVHLTSTGRPALPAPAEQPGTLDTLAAFADECPPGTPWLEQVTLLHREADLAELLPVHEPADNPLLAQLRAAVDAGYTTATVILSGAGLDIAVSRRRHRAPRRQPVGA